ncbi:MAG TPA: HYR domain-containing protein [Gaiellaceae bacterium]|nr:HYR domain-containing protein [Gaiellaceae bacterium]
MIVSPAGITVATVLGVTAGITPGRGATAMPSGTLTLNASLRLTSSLGACVPPAGADHCAARTIHGPFPGLGALEGRYEFLVDQGPPACAGDDGRALAYPTRLAVTGKGEIHVAVAEAAECVPAESIRTQTQTFAVTGGTGIYTGASGSGTLERRLGGETASGRVGTETWTGTLSVPGLEFDTTPPVFSGAVGRTVRAPRRATRVRVVFAVTASDETDGAVPVSCHPRSGGLFRVGRTVMTCSATDTSANTATARFTVTVTRRR